MKIVEMAYKANISCTFIVSNNSKNYAVFYKRQDNSWKCMQGYCYESVEDIPLEVLEYCDGFFTVLTGY